MPYAKTERDGRNGAADAKTERDGRNGAPDAKTERDGGNEVRKKTMMTDQRRASLIINVEVGVK